MAVSLVLSQSKTNTDLSLEEKSNDITWDEADYTWDEADGSWDRPGYVLDKTDKTNVSLSLESK